MGKRLTVSLCALALTILAAGCGGSDNTNAGNMNATNANSTAATETMPMTSGADGEIVTTEADGVRTQTRTFSNNPRVQRVVVTTDTRTGKRTARVYTTGGQVRDLPESEVDRALTATGEAVADAAGAVADKAEDVGRPVADKAEDIGREAADKAEDVGRGAADKAEDVGRPVVRGAKKVGEKTVDGAKKVGDAVKDAVKP